MTGWWAASLCFFFFSIWLLSVLHGHSVFSSPPPTSNDFLSLIFINHIYFPIIILEKEPLFPFLMFSAKQGNCWYHFYNSSVGRGPWLGIEPGTSRTRSQHSTTRLSRGRLPACWNEWLFIVLDPTKCLTNRKRI